MKYVCLLCDILPTKEDVHSVRAFVTHAHVWILRAYHRTWIIHTVHDMSTTYHHPLNQSSSVGYLGCYQTFTVIIILWINILGQIPLHICALIL